MESARRTSHWIVRKHVYVTLSMEKQQLCVGPYATKGLFRENFRVQTINNLK